MSGRGVGHDEPDDVEATARWLILDGAPALTGETAAAATELLSSVIDAIEGEYAAEIRGYRQRRWRRPERVPDPEAPWRDVAERQLALDLGDEDYF